jgi:hypothetical protein
MIVWYRKTMFAMGLQGLQAKPFVQQFLYETLLPLILLPPTSTILAIIFNCTNVLQHLVIAASSQTLGLTAKKWDHVHDYNKNTS